MAQAQAELAQLIRSCFEFHFFWNIHWLTDWLTDCLQGKLKGLNIPSSIAFQPRALIKIRVVPIGLKEENAAEILSICLSIVQSVVMSALVGLVSAFLNLITYFRAHQT